MDWISKALLTALVVAALMIAARAFGHRVAGILAGLPTVTGPALLWMALDRGADAAALAALGSIAGCALCAVFAFAYERASRRAGPWLAVLAATATSALGLPLAGGLDLSLPFAVAAGVSVVLVLYVGMPHDATPPGRRAFSPTGEILLTAVVSGSISGAVALGAPQLGAFWAGVLASPPLIAALIAMRQHARDGAPAAAVFLRGYVGGLVGRIGFAAAFALLPALMPLPLASVAAFAIGCALTMLGIRLLHPPTLARARRRLRSTT